MSTTQQSTEIQTLSYAQASAQALSDAMQADKRVIALGEDVGRGGIFAQYRGLPEKFGPERVFDTPISEAGIVGAAVGMALTGLRPVVEMRVVDFALCAIDEIVNQAAKNRYMFGGQGRVPLVIRMPIGMWTGSAAQHSQSLESWFAHIPGLVVITPSCAQDNYSLLRAAIACDDPVVYLEHKELWPVEGPVDTSQAYDEQSIRSARILRAGSDITVVSWSRTANHALLAADLLADQGINAEVIDLRTIWPWDVALVAESCRRTGRLLVTHEAVQTAGFGAEVAARMAEEVGVPVARHGALRIPVGYAANLEDQAKVTVESIAAKVRACLNRA